MNRQELIRDMKKENGSFINITQLAKYMNVSRDKVRAEIVNGLDYYPSGRKKMYFVNDVADRILQQRGM